MKCKSCNNIIKSNKDIKICNDCKNKLKEHCERLYNKNPKFFKALAEL